MTQKLAVCPIKAKYTGANDEYKVQVEQAAMVVVNLGGISGSDLLI